MIYFIFHKDAEALPSFTLKKNINLSFKTSFDDRDQRKNASATVWDVEADAFGVRAEKWLFPKTLDGCSPTAGRRPGDAVP